MKPTIQLPARIVFIGDSITNASRNHDDPGSLGEGYVRVIANSLPSTVTSEVWNRGVSGDAAVDVAARWDEDCLNLAPTVVSLLIGVNDTWRSVGGNLPPTIDKFAATVESLVLRTQMASDAAVVIVEPFELVLGQVTNAWAADMQLRRHALRAISEAHSLIYVATQAQLDAESVRVGAQNLLHDGIHPTPAGHELIARRWLAECLPGLRGLTMAMQ